MKKIFIILLLIIPFASFSQYELTIKSNFAPIYVSDGDTLSTCRDSMIIFQAVVTNGIDIIQDADYFWDFDNGITSGLNKDSVTRIYEEGGGYRVKLKVVKGVDEWFTILPIKVAMKPNYSQTKVDLPEGHEGICLGTTAPVIGKAYPEIWEDEPIYELIEENRKFIDDNNSYNSHLFFDEFSISSNFALGNIDSVGLKILHADMGDLQIKLTCENGNSVILKDFASTNHLLLGDTATNTEYQYYWSESASQTMNSISTATDNIIPESHYLPEQSFNNLIGCKLNGKWTIDITDNQNIDSGFVYSWNIVFNEDILPPVWSFKDTLLQYIEQNGNIYGTYWSGKNPGASSVLKIGDTIIANTNVEPDTYGNNKYTFNVVNNWVCPQDTFVMVNVEKASFTATPEGGEAKLDVEFENTTTWATERDWYFGDNSNNELIVDTDTISHKYIEKGDYEVILIVTNDTGCKDTDTITIKITVEPSKLDKVPNMFSPNGDGINEVYKFTEDNLKGMKTFSLRIYNRWGQKVYETDDMEEAINVGWDGKNLLGLTCSPGIYFYVIKAKGKDQDPDDKEINHDKKGTIHLYR